MVVTTHALDALVRRGALGLGYRDLAWFLGWTGVTTFFVISGLIMIRTGWSGFGRPRAALAFLMRRLIRIVPLYWLATAIFALAEIVQHHALDPGHLAKSLLFIPYTDPESGLIRPIAGQGWTLDYEMGFYAMFAIALLFRKKTGTLALLALLSLLVAVGLVFRPLIPYRDAATPFEFWTDPILLAFCIGIGIGLYEIRLPRWHSFSFPLAGTLLIFGVEGALCGPIGPAYRLPIYGASCALAVLLCTSTRARISGPVGRALETAGDASYSTYLFHPLLLMVLDRIWDHMPARFHAPLPFVLLAVVGSNLLGYASYRLIEQRVFGAAILRGRGRLTARPLQSVTEPA
jgi:exopolysaccharide production protein ExoZ